MSDLGRESLTDKIGSAAKVRISGSIPAHRLIHLPQPDSQKSTTEQAGDMLKGKGDSAASTMQPNVRGFFVVVADDVELTTSTERQVCYAAHG